MSPFAFSEPASAAASAAVDRFWADVGLKVRNARLEKRWSAEGLAAAAGVSRTALYLVERGDGASLELLIRLVTALGLRLEAVVADPRRRDRLARSRLDDPVHAAMGEL